MVRVGIVLYCLFSLERGKINLGMKKGFFFWFIKGGIRVNYGFNFY